MLKLAYKSHKFSAKTKEKIALANMIIDEYVSDGYTLTLRQLYYQMVARNYIPNTTSEYKKLVNVVTNARLAGLIAWDVIEDRTRPLRGNNHWDNPQDGLRWLRDIYQIDKWTEQEYHVEVWIEKDALVGVISDVCRDNDVYYMSSRGYPSITSVWKAARRLPLKKYGIILHMSDHDPSGVDMSRDLQDRLDMFAPGRFIVDRIALTMKQISTYDPPPNPTKWRDSRFDGYVSKFGHDCWELDALSPKVIVDLVQFEIEKYRDDRLWTKAIELEREHLKTLSKYITMED